MKKQILTFLLAAATVGGGFAFGPVRKVNPGPDFKTGPMVGELSRKMMTRADNDDALEDDTQSLDYTLADGIYTAYSFQNMKVGTEIYQAFEIPADVATTFAGDEITSVNVFTGCMNNNGSAGPNQILDITVYIFEDLNGEPVYTQEGKLTSEVFTEHRVALDTPYKIEAGKGVYIGYSFKLPNTNQMYLVIDGYATNEVGGCWIGVKQDDSLSWANYADQIGNLCIGCTIEGDNMPQNSIRLMAVGGMIYTTPGKPFTYQLLLKGGCLSAESVEVQYTVGSGEPKTATFTMEEEPLGYNQYGILTIDDMVCNDEGLEIPMTFELTKVNGEANGSDKNKASAAIDCYPAEKGFPRVHLIEEGTGNGCGWCVRGIVMMEYVAEVYPDMFARMAIHGNIPSKDPMTVSSTSSWINKYATSGFPVAWINRTTNLEYMSIDEIDEFVSLYEGVPALLGFNDLSAEVGENETVKANVKVASHFNISNNNRYRLGFYISQDNVGPYRQTNYYAGGGYGEMGGWEHKGKSVSMEYNDVVRLMVGGVNGISNSLAAEFKEGVESEWEETINISAVNSDKFFLTAYIFDTKGGEVVNAKQIEVTNPYYSGINDVAKDNGTVVGRKLYNLSGVEVTEPAGGIYILRSVYSDGTVKAEKVTVK